jgi:hypothetical protein
MLTLAVGGHWIVLQSAAWVGMFVKYASEDSLPDALIKTFDGSHACRVCEFVQDGRNSEDRQDMRNHQQIRLDFLLQIEVPGVFPPKLDESWTEPVRLLTHAPNAPPHPPPRLG